MKRERGGGNKKFYKLCDFGIFDDVLAALPTADPNFVHGTNNHPPLMCVCSRNDWLDEETTSIVQKLLAKGADVNTISSRWQAIHYAVKNTCPDVVKLLLDAGAQLEYANREGYTPLLYACRWGREETVVLLLGRGANVRAVNRCLETALMLACQNGAHGALMIPHLIKAGVDPYARSAGDEYALEVAIGANGAAMTQALLRHVTYDEADEDRFRYNTTNDPIGSLVMCREIQNMFSSRDQLAYAISNGHHADVVWSRMRLSSFPLLDGSSNDVFAVMRTCQDPKVWGHLMTEVSKTIHPKTRESLLHIAAQTGNADVVRVVMSHNINPLRRNIKEKRAVDLAIGANVKQLLRQYTCWKPEKERMSWFGPYFGRRVKALLLCLNRLRPTLPNEMTHAIITILSEAEYTFVESK